MKTIVYRRASTDRQAYDQQKRSVQNWLDQHSIVADRVEEEKESGSKKHTERILFDVITKCDKGDQIIVSEFSRLSRSMSDANSIIDLCIKKGVNLITIKENLHIRGDMPADLTTKLLTMIFGLAAEIELGNIKSRSQSGINCVKDTIKKQGYAVSKRTGLKFSKFGDPNPIHLAESAAKANAASAIAKRAKKLKDTSFLQASEVATLLRNGGLSNKEIADRLNLSGFKTTRGFEFIAQSVSKLIADRKKMIK